MCYHSNLRCRKTLFSESVGSTQDSFLLPILSQLSLFSIYSDFYYRVERISIDYALNMVIIESGLFLAIVLEVGKNFVLYR